LETLEGEGEPKVDTLVTSDLGGGTGARGKVEGLVLDKGYTLSAGGMGKKRWKEKKKGNKKKKEGGEENTPTIQCSYTQYGLFPLAGKRLHINRASDSPRKAKWRQKQTNFR